jgi:hypothetical protein
MTALATGDWLTLAEVRRVAKCGFKLLYREVAAGRLRAARLGGRRGPIRVHVSWVQAWLEASAQPAELPTTRDHGSFARREVDGRGDEHAL